MDETRPDPGVQTVGHKMAGWRESEDPIDRHAVLSRVQQNLFADVDEPLRIGRFEVSERIGAGATGVVYSAYDPQLDRHVALKLLRPEADLGDEAKDRLLREAKTLARLSHPHIVAVHDVGDLDGRVFIAMELLEGGTVRQWVEAEPRSVEAILNVYLGAGEGLAAAHRSGLVHRDFKPDNVLLDDRGQARVVDFGLAREQADPGMSLIDVAATDDHPIVELGARLTQTGAVLGTPAYMAPEQFGGRPADARTDQFAFCVSLYEALYDERPFAGTTLPALSLAASRGEVRPASNARKVPQRIRKALLRGLEPNPSRRHRSMAVLLHALRNDPWPRRRRVAMVGAAVAAAVGITWSATRGNPGTAVPICSGFEQHLAGHWDDERRAKGERTLLALDGGDEAWESLRDGFDAYADAWVAERRATCEAGQRGEQSAALLDRRVLCLDRARLALDALATRVTEVEQDSLMHVDALVPDSRWIAHCSSRGVLDDGVPPPADSVLREQLQRIEADIAEASSLRVSGRYREALALAQALQEPAAALQHPPTYARALEELAADLGVSRRLPEAIDALSRALNEAERGRADRARVELTAKLAERLADTGQFSEARRRAAEAEALYDRLAERPDDAQFVLNVLWGHIEWTQGHFSEAIERYDRALQDAPDLSESALTELYTEAMAHRGAATLESGKPDEALPFFEQALETALHNLGPQHPEVAVLHDNIGSAYFRLGQFDQARTHFEYSLESRVQQLGPEHESLADVHTNLGALALKQGDNEQALRHMDRSIRLMERSRGRDSAQLARPLTNKALVHLRLDQDEQALASVTRAYELRRAALGANHVSTIDSLYQLAYVNQQIGNLEESRRLYERHLGLLPTDGARAAADSIYTLIGLADIALTEGRPRDAQRMMEQAMRTLQDGAAFAPLRPAVHFNLARALDAQHRAPERARELAQRARDGATGDVREEITRWLAARSPTGETAP